MASQGPVRGIVRAPASVRASLEEPVRPRISPTTILLIVMGVNAFIGVAVFAVFAVTGAVAPSLTGGVGVGKLALWALLFAVLNGIVESVIMLIVKLYRRHRMRKAAEDTRDRPVWRTVLRLAGNTALSAVIAVLVLASQGLGAAQIAWLACILGVLFGALPVVLDSLLDRLVDALRHTRERSG